MNQSTYNSNLLIQSISDYAINMLDDACNVISWNKGAEKILGYTAEEVIGKNFRIFFNQEDVSRMVPEKMMKKIKLEGVINYEGWRMRKNGEAFWSEISLTALFDGDNNITGYSVIARDVTEKKRAHDFEQNNLHALINNTHSLMWSVDRNYKLITGNNEFDKLVLQLSGKIIERGEDVLSVGFTKEQLARFKKRYDRAFAGEIFTEVEYTAPPYEYWSEISFHPIVEDGIIVGTACHSHDISGKIRGERRITHLNRLYNFISQINQIIIHAKNEQTLFRETCKLATEVGKFKVAWIGKLSHEYETISLVEQSGFTEADLSLFADAPCKNGGPTETVVSTGGYTVCNNVNEELDLKGWQSFATTHNFQSCMVLPVKCFGEIIGTFNLYAGETNYFNEEEITLLQKATENISFAMEVFEKERQRILAEEKSSHSRLRMKQAQEIAHFGSWELDFATGVITWSDEACRIYGLTPKESKQSYASWISFIHPDDLKHVMKVTKAAEETLSNVSFYHRIVTGEGVIRQLRSHAHHEFDTERKPIGLYGVAHDITEELANIIQLKNQNAQLENIAWIQSHKVRGPLATILGLAQQFKESDSEEETTMIIKGIQTTSEKLDRVIHEIVDKTGTAEIHNSFHSIPE